ncbi:SusD family protein [compost metagenome]
MDKLIFNERAREFAFEGRRWYDLMLQSKLNGKNMLADAVAAKYPAKDQAVIRARLMDEKNWYIPVNPKLWE